MSDTPSDLGTGLGSAVATPKTDVAFVARRQIPPAPPPPGSSGPLLWIRENLFPDLLNTALTLLSIAFLVSVLPGLWQWAVAQSVWNANSLDECRQIMDTAFGAGERGACWAIINERIGQFMYGRYPVDLRWRPTLAFALLFVAMAPVLFASLPFRRTLLILTVTYPAVAYFLIWGGSVFGPLLVLAGPIVAYLAWRVLESVLQDPFGEEVGGALAKIGGVLALILWFLFGVAAADEALTRGVADNRIPDRVAELNAMATDPALDQQAQASARAERDNLLSLDEQRAELSSLERQLSRLGAEPVEPRPEGAEISDGVRRADAIGRYVGDLIGDPQTIGALAAALDAASAADEARIIQEMTPDARERVAAYQTLEGQVIAEETRLWSVYKDLGRLGFEPVESSVLGGFLLTLVIGVTAISASLPIGILLALGRQSGLIFIRMVSVVIIETIRGVPLITLLFVASTLLNYFLPPGTAFDIILRVLILATLFSAAYIAEAVRGGLAALPKGQYEAADAMGLTYWQSMRLIILPQALKIAIPSIVNIFIGLFKDTTLVSIIGLFDPLGIIQPILADSRWQGIYAEVYIFVAVLFFFCCFGMSRYSMYLERKLKTDRH